MLIDGQFLSINMGSVEMEIYDSFRSAYKIFGYEKSESFGINAKILNLCEMNNLNLTVKFKGQRFKITPSRAFDFILKYNSIQNLNGIKLFIISKNEFDVYE